MATSRSSSSYPSVSYAGTTFHYSCMQADMADRALAMGFPRDKVFDALTPRWDELEGLVVTPDGDFANYVTNVLGISSS